MKHRLTFRNPNLRSALTHAVLGLCTAIAFASPSSGQAPARDISHAIGPYDVNVLQGGGELSKPIAPNDTVLEAGSPFTISFWVKDERLTSDTLIAGLGHPEDEDARLLGIKDGHVVLYTGSGLLITASSSVLGKGWHLLAASSDGSLVRLFVDESQVASGSPLKGRISPVLSVGPLIPMTLAGWTHFGGEVANLTVLRHEVLPEGIRAMAKTPPDDQLIRFEEASKPWPVQIRGQAGLLAPQDPGTLPHSRAPLGKAVATPLRRTSTLEPVSPGTWKIAGNWKLQAAPKVADGPQSLSSIGFHPNSWMDATVPGTVLTTMVDRGIYPDPDFGLNNMAIPESLNKQDYWYRVEFPTPAESRGKQAVLDFEGINYSAEAWLNGKRIGDIRGAFLRGEFDISTALASQGMNVLAVRVSPPPHPGIPHEQSIAAGAGENGGALCLDGPTFVATEGWDWIPAIRDRNTGIWQDVLLKVTDRLRLEDPKVVTTLPLPNIDSADIRLDVPIRNLGAERVNANVHASFEGVEISAPVSLEPGLNLVHLDPSHEHALHVDKPRLWWPNGYGKPDLYHLKLSVDTASGPSDHKELTFGIREVTYELTAYDHTGSLQRVEIAPTQLRGGMKEVLDVRHEGMVQTAEYYAPSLTLAGESSPSVKKITDEPGFTDLVIKVNGVRIAARGGNWGMDDSRKRVSREHLEPFFRLHKEANLNIIRNWVGQDTEEVFFQLADEYGLMVWNDFWASTQNFNAEPQDVPLFLRNAQDVVRRFRNHPSIILWCGRNEGVPQPILNEGLIQLLTEEDGTRYYTPGSNRIDLRDSGPYKYQDPKLYYTKLDKGFSVELGIASLSTLESLRASMPAPDRWPISDTWAYHDWHFGGNGDTAPLLQHIEEQFGAGTSLEDFERKAQMFNYVDHRAIFEGFTQHLWSPNSGRMLWMTQPAWPSNMWQIFSSDYDTQASFYAVKKASEPLHAQLDLSDYTVAAVNTTRTPSPGVVLKARVFSLTNKLLLEREQSLDLKENTVTPLFKLGLGQIFTQEPIVLVELRMTDASGSEVSRNVYWLAEKERGYRGLNSLPPATLTTHATQKTVGKENVIEFRISNIGQTAALMLKGTLLTAKGERILPAYFSDNYVSLLPGEQQTLTVRYPSSSYPQGDVGFSLRGWNMAEGTIAVSR